MTRADRFLVVFLAFGLGKYKTVLDFKNTDNTTTTERYNSSGGVLKAGVRLFMGERFFAGVYYKKLKNNTDIAAYTYDLGGELFCFEIGIVDF